jgi:hypothetical protein
MKQNETNKMPKLYMFAMQLYMQQEKQLQQTPIDCKTQKGIK